jgi:hypothetical protein
MENNEQPKEDFCQTLSNLLVMEEDMVNDYRSYYAEVSHLKNKLLNVEGSLSRVENRLKRIRERIRLYTTNINNRASAHIS